MASSEISAMTITADELLIAEALHKRPARARDLAREIEAINDLARGMVREPAALQGRFVELATEVSIPLKQN